MADFDPDFSESDSEYDEVLYEVIADIVDEMTSGGYLEPDLDSEYQKDPREYKRILKIYEKDLSAAESELDEAKQNYALAEIKYDALMMPVKIHKEKLGELKKKAKQDKGFVEN